jgi:hypothetical protein
MPTEYHLLRELAKLYERYPSKQTATINSDLADDLHSQIYRGLLNPSVTNENDLRAKLRNDVSKKYFAVLRDQVKQKLFNSLFNMELTADSSSSYRRATYRNARTLFITQTLSMFGLGSAAHRTMRKGLKEAQKYELTSNSLEFLRMLATEASLDGLESEVTSLNLEIHHCIKVLTIEIEANALWDELVAGLAITGKTTQRLVKLAQRASSLIGVMYNEYPLFNIGRIHFRVLIIALELDGCFEEALQMCVQARDFLHLFPQFQSPSFDGEYTMKQLECALHVGNYVAAKQAALDCNKLYTPANPNWCYFKGTEFFLYLHMSQPKAAESVYNEVTSHPRFDFLPEHVKYRWQLFEMYLEYTQMKFKDLAFAKQRLNSLHRIPHSIVGYLKDKTGFNLSILILEFLILFESKQYAGLAERLVALDLYRQRYLKGDQNSKKFITFLEDVARHSDDKNAMMRSKARYLKALGDDRSTTMIEGIQILPFRLISEQMIGST